MKRNVFKSLIMAMVCGIFPASQVDAAGCAKPVGCHADDGCGSEMLICRPVIEMKKVKKTCFEVECEYICIPQVHCPLFSWLKNGLGVGAEGSCTDQCGTAACGDCHCQADCGESGCNGCECAEKCPKGPLSARIRRVNRLKKVTYECEECVVTWKLERCQPGDCGNGGCKPGCGSTPIRGSAPSAPPVPKSYE